MRLPVKKKEPKNKGQSKYLICNQMQSSQYEVEQRCCITNTTIRLNNYFKMSSNYNKQINYLGTLH
jgi:hypothetical protein